jgi:cysteine synthase
VTIFMPSWMSEERRRLIRSYGAEIVSVSREQGGFLGSLRLSREYAASRENVFLPLQFDNQANVEAHFDGTGRRSSGSWRSAACGWMLLWLEWARAAR